MIISSISLRNWNEDWINCIHEALTFVPLDKQPVANLSNTPRSGYFSDPVKIKCSNVWALPLLSFKKVYEYVRTHTALLAYVRLTGTTTDMEYNGLARSAIKTVSPLASWTKLLNPRTPLNRSSSGNCVQSMEDFSVNPEIISNSSAANPC